MSKKTYLIILVGICVALTGALLWQCESRRDQPNKVWLSPVPRFAPSVSITKDRLHRYDASRDPKLFPSAARDYYARRESMIRTFHGNAQIENTLKGLQGGKDLLRWLGRVQTHEIIEALPLVAGLLHDADMNVQLVAAQVLCSFGDKRGFDFVMSKIEGPDSAKWWGVFLKDFASQNPTQYLPRIKALLTSKADSEVDVYVAAQVLAQLGDADSVRYLVPVHEREPSMSIDAILMLKNIRDPGVTALMHKISQEGSPSKMKHAADVVLASQGDVTAQRRLMEVAKRVSGLPQPLNADGTYKPGMKPKVFGEITPAWDDDAVFALEHGIEAVVPDLAVPVLRDIAIDAENVRFSRTAIVLLAKIGSESARNALWDVARSVQVKRRTFEDTLFTTTGKALMLFDDSSSASLAEIMFNGDKHVMETSQFLAETRGWEGLFKLDLFY
jgi:hypothetical protein